MQTVKVALMAASAMLPILVASCSAPATSELVSSTSATWPTSTIQTTSTVAPRAPTTTVTEAQTLIHQSAEFDWQAVESAASGFMVARQDRDVAAAQSFLDDGVIFDWGPNDGRDGLEAAWAWEDAFRLTQTLEECEALADGNVPTARCRLRVDSAVAEAAGYEAGFVCVDLTVEGSLITGVHALSGADGCAYNYWAKTFEPFSKWLADAHPDADINRMYSDRISAEGLALWVQYTNEYMADHA